MDNRQFWSFQQSGEARKLFVLDEIARYESWWSDTVTAKRFTSQLNSGSGDVQVYIDSPGGDAFAGATMYSALKEYSTSGKGRVIVCIQGLAASAASLVAMAGDEVRISLTGTIMIHDPWSGVQGNADKLRATADILDEIREGQIRAYMGKSGLGYDDVLALIRGDGTYMNAKTAIEKGFADCLMEEDEAGDEWIQALGSMRVSSCVQRESEYIRAAMEAQAKENSSDNDEAARVLLAACIASY